MEWGHGITYGDVEKDSESNTAFSISEEADVPVLFQLFEMFEKSGRTVEKGLVYPAFDLALKCSHVFNLLDARGSISVSGGPDYINKSAPFRENAASDI